VQEEEEEEREEREERERRVSVLSRSRRGIGLL